MKVNRNWLGAVSALALTVGVGDPTLARNDTVLDTLTLSATREDDAPIDQLSSTSVVTEAELERIQPDTVEDMLRAVPGVTVQQDARDTGSAINVRGLQDFGRVNVTIDGARQNFQRSGHNANGIFYIDPELVEKVTVIRGPVANVFGSGAIGGVVTFETINPFDFLKPGERVAASVKGQALFNGDGYMTSATGAAGFWERFGVLANVVYRDQDNYEDGDGNEIIGSAREILSGLGKAQLRFNEETELVIGYVSNDSKYRSGAGNRFSPFRDNEVENRTATGKFTWDSSSTDLINLTGNAYWTGTRAEQVRLDTGVERFFDIETIGIDVYNTSGFFAYGFDHALTIGLDAFEDTVETEDLTGPGDEATPSGERRVYGGFIQHQIERGEWLDIIGALRFDAYKLEGVNGDTMLPIESSGDRVSPKITIGLSPFQGLALDGLQIYGTYAEGYRAPAITETLVSGFHPPPARFEFLPNPDLRPEVGKTLELGLNYKRDDLFYQGDAFRLKAALFHNDVEDYIGGVWLPPESPMARFGPYQYQNIANAEIEGFELEATYDTGGWFASLSGHIIRGEDADTGEYLNSIPPDKLSTTLGMRLINETLTIGATLHAVAEQNRVASDDLKSEAHSTVDLFAFYEPNENFTFGGTIDNVFDEDYRTFLNAQGGDSAGIGGKVWAKVRFGT